ncbi:hypothetical protein BGZ63DRAFT_383461, partial [Mariannaea sp. PMI_226]
MLPLDVVKTLVSFVCRVPVFPPPSSISTSSPGQLSTLPLLSAHLLVSLPNWRLQGFEQPLVERLSVRHYQAILAVARRGTHQPFQADVRRRPWARTFIFIFN